jgi:drug/metabolite transporter (DMT)-like permease
MIAFAAVYVLWGSTFLAMRFAVATIPPFLMAGTRHTLAGLIMCAIGARRVGRWPSAAEWRTAVIVGVLLLCIGNGGVAWAEQHVPSGISALLVATVPVWMVLADWLRPRGVHPGIGVIAGLVMGLAGLLWLVGPGEFTGHGTIDTMGAIALLGGSLTWGVGSIIAQHSPRPASPVLGTGMQMVAGGGALLLVSLAVGEPARFAFAQVTLKSALGWGYLLVFGSMLGFTAYVYLLGATTAAKVSTYAYVNPLVAVGLGWAFAGEALTARTLLAAAVILGGVAIITASRSETMTAVAEEGIGD